MESTVPNSFATGKALSAQLRAVTPEQIAAMTQRLEHIHANSVDYVAPGSALQAHVRSDGVVTMVMSQRFMAADVGRNFEIAPVAHEQVADKLGIPRKYYQRIVAEAPGLAAANINYWLAHDGEEYMLRTLDGRIRAMLSTRYRSLDSYDLFFHTYETAKEVNAVLTQMDLTDRRLYMRLMQPGFAAKIIGRGEDLAAKGKLFSSGYKHDDGTWQVADDDDPDGDWIFPTIVASDSDIGHGGLRVELGMLRPTCRNLILVGQKLHKVHLGGERESGLQLASDTQAAKDKATWLEVRDLIRTAFNEEDFRKMVAQAGAAKLAILEEPIEAVDRVVAHYDFNKERRDAILNELVSPSYGGNPGVTTWGLVQAVTAQAHKDEELDSTYELARIGGELLVGNKVEELGIKIRKA